MPPQPTSKNYAFEFYEKINHESDILVNILEL